MYNFLNRINRMQTGKEIAAINLGGNDRVNNEQSGYTSTSKMVIDKRMYVVRTHSSIFDSIWSSSFFLLFSFVAAIKMRSLTLCLSRSPIDLCQKNVIITIESIAFISNTNLHHLLKQKHKRNDKDDDQRSPISDNVRDNFQVLCS